MPGKSFPQTQSASPPSPAALTWPFLLQQPHIGGEGEPRAGWMPSRGRGGRSGMLVVAGSFEGGKALAALSDVRRPGKGSRLPVLPGTVDWGASWSHSTMAPEPGRTPI